MAWTGTARRCAHESCPAPPWQRAWAIHEMQTPENDLPLPRAMMQHANAVRGASRQGCRSPRGRRSHGGVLDCACAESGCGDGSSADENESAHVLVICRGRGGASLPPFFGLHAFDSLRVALVCVQLGWRGRSEE